ncbi:MAG: hypothetical protein Q7T74_03395 [Candidatus Saccharibacteria bacterium]|nr:hypothetical protein [Candidatus Saccharibacteria bacterium]
MVRSFQETLDESNVSNDDKIGDNPQAALEVVRAIGKEQFDNTHADRQKVVNTKFEHQETLDDAAREASRVGIRGLFRKVIGAGKPVSEFQPPVDNVVDISSAPHGDQFEIPGQHKKDIAA